MEPVGSIPDTPCPDRAVLASFLAGRLDGPSRAALDTHVASCTRCASVLSELSLSGDTAVARLRGLPAVAPEPDEAGFRRMRDAALGLPFDATVSQAGGPVRVEAEDTLIDPQVGPYQVLERVGAGGMGVVYHARHTRLASREAAIKMVRFGAHAGAATLARFRTEAEAVAKLRHPHIAALYDYGDHHGLPYLALEWVAGETLAARLEAEPLEIGEAAGVVRTVAEAIAYAHGQEVVHRDLKPGNILLTNAEGGSRNAEGKPGTAEGVAGSNFRIPTSAFPVPKVVDFGLAKMLDTEEPGATGTDAVMGTPGYLAPEQAGAAGTAGAAADVWGLGAVLYACLTGRPPFVGKDRLDTLRLVREAEVEPPSRHRPEIPPDLEAVCLKCLEKEPGRRYASAQKLADDLGRWLRGEPTEVRPLGRWGRWRRQARRHARRLAVAGLVLVCLGTATVAVAIALRTPPDPEQMRREAAAARLADLQARLARGEEVTLIGPTGEPTWFEWRAGRNRGQTSPAADDTFSVHVQGIGLIELLPYLERDEYELTAQVRHDWSDYPGRAGLYVGRAIHPREPRDVHAFLELTFNSVRGDPPVVLPPPAKKQPDRLTTVELAYRLHSEPGSRPEVGMLLGGVSGPRIPVLGKDNGKWFDLALAVSPGGVTGRFNGTPMDLPRERLVQDLGRVLPIFRKPHAGDPAIQAMQPGYTPHGGLGLFVWSGSVSYRNVTVRPMKPGM